MIYKKYCFCIFFNVLASCILSTNLPELRNAIKFTENKGQWETSVLYKAQLDGGALFLERNAFTYYFYDKELLRRAHDHPSEQINIANIKSHAFKIDFINSISPFISQSIISSDYVNYFIGNDSKKWKSKVYSYKQITYTNLYEGIALEVAGLNNSIKYNFIVHAGADAKNIKMHYKGIDEIRIDNKKLKITTSVNEITEQEPFSYQWVNGRKVNVPTQFTLSNDTVSFYFPEGYNRLYSLIIDPTLIFASYSGSIADNFGMTATYDAQGHLYSGGTAYAAGYPTTLGAFNTTYSGVITGGRTDVVISKYSPDGSNLIYSTYLGGASGTEIVSSIIVNSQNELFLYGATGSSDFPTSVNAFDRTFNGGTPINLLMNIGNVYNNGTDIYVSKLNSDGSQLIGSTYLGGSSNDGVNASTTLVYNYGDNYRGEIMLDNFDNCYIASCTYSTNFPVTASVFKTFNGGGLDGCVVKLKPDLSDLIWSTYLGGSADDGAYAITVDDSLKVYVTGGTASNNFSSTAGVYKTTYQGGLTDGYIARINKNGDSIISTYLGTDVYDQSFFIQLDESKNIYVYGQSEGDFLVFPATVYNNANSHQFINKFDNNLTNLIYGTVVGNGNGQINLSPSAFLVDDCENIYLSGWGGNIVTGVPVANLPLTTNAFQSTTDGHNFYLMVLEKDLNSLIYATYFGGGVSEEHVDGGTSRFDKKGIVYQSVCAGCGGNNDFPTTAGAWSRVNRSTTPTRNCNNGVFKFDFEVKLAKADFTSDQITGCAPLTVQFNNSSSGTSFKWDFGGNDTTSIDPNPIRTYTNPGTYLVKLFANDPTSCNITDSAYKYITVHPKPIADFDYSLIPCTTGVLFADSSDGNGSIITNWFWSFGDNQNATQQNPNHTYQSSNNQLVEFVVTTEHGCRDTSETLIEFPFTNPISISSDTILCGTIDRAIQLQASGGIDYKWTPSTFLSDDNSPNPICIPSSSITYSVSVKTILTNGDTCTYQGTTTITVVDTTLIRFTISADRETIQNGESTGLHVSPNIYFYSWTPSNTLNSSTISDPIASPDKTTTYVVLIKDSVGCSYEKSITIKVLPNYCGPPDIFVPNSFSPNDDQKNDVLYVRGNNIKELYFIIYNRWGEKMFETTNQQIGWDGTYKGKKLNPDVYGYYLKAICFKEQEYTQKGNVTLLR